MAKFSEEFPDFPASEMPAIPEGFEDVSWRNDACPAFENEAKRLRLFVDYLDPEKREFPETTRFSLHRWKGDGDVIEAVEETDSWEEILAAIDAN